jgi:hypothetical protein
MNLILHRPFGPSTEKVLDDVPVLPGAIFKAYAVVKDEKRILFRGVFLANLCLPGAIMLDTSFLFAFKGPWNER